MAVALAISLPLTIVTRFLFSFGGPYPSAYEAFLFLPYFSLSIGWLLLLGIWCGLGKGHVLLRLLGMTAAALVLLLGSFYDTLGELFKYNGALGCAVTLAFFTPVVGTALAVGLLRQFRTRLRFWPSDIDELSPGLQFSLKQLFMVTTIAALVFLGASGIRRLYQTVGGIHPMAFVAFSAVAAIGYPLIALTSTTACLALRQVAPRLIVASVTAVTVALFPLVIVPFDTVGMIFYVGSTLCGTIFVVLTLWQVRRCGYRLVPNQVQVDEAGAAPDPPPGLP
jgi:hypothetical protein